MKNATGEDYFNLTYCVLWQKYVVTSFLSVIVEK